MANSADYYDDATQHGQYQYITMREIVDEFMMSTDEDDFHNMVPRYKILYQARRAFKELYYDVANDIRAISLELSPTLQVTLPPDFVNYVRISWVDENKMLHPMAVDMRMSIAQEYLQDESYNLLYDEEGCVLIGTDSLEANSNSENDSGSIDDVNSGNSITSYLFQPNKDFSLQFPNGKVRLDKDRGIIQFGSDVFGKEVVLEYISDGLFTGCEGRPEDELRIHKFCESAVHDYIFHKLINRRRNVPANRIQMAEKSFNNSRRLAKRRLMTLRKDELLQVFKGSNKWIKGV
jgi:hypothetical protein